MKRKNQKNSSQAKAVHNVKKASYIGALLVVVLCSFGLILAMRLPDIALSGKEAVPMPLPTPPTAPATTKPDAVATRPPLPTPIPSAPPAEESIAVSAIPETLQIILPTEGTVTVPFTGDQLVYSKTLQDWRAHTGIDMEAPAGTSVVAAADGTIVRAYTDVQMGDTVIIRHGDLYQTVYQNLADLEGVTEGQSVKRGDVIGKVGHSAAAELLQETHLHFAVLSGENFQNPLNFLITP